MGFFVYSRGKLVHDKQLLEPSPWIFERLRI